MGIEPDDIAQVRSATDLVAIISERTEIKRVGRQWMARCPMHGERTPSLSVSAEKGVYYCFGCRRSGDAITFVREMDGIDFVDAVERLASRAGISLRYTRPNEASAHKRRRRLLEAVARASDFYHERLLKADDAGPARAYLRSRGYDGDVVRRYRVGWAPDGWDLLSRHLKLSSHDLRASGLGRTVWDGAAGRARSGWDSADVDGAAGRSGPGWDSADADGAAGRSGPGWDSADADGAAGRGMMNSRRSERDFRQHDFFCARVMFPISDEQGNPVAFGGRVLPGAKAKGPKYMNTSSEAVIYEKSRVLYGLNEHRAEIVRQGQAVICEGYTDVIGAAAAGVDTAVATCGTALTEQHVKLLKRFSADRLVLAFDADTAGKVAADRVYEWERKHELEVFVAALPDGSDPDDLARTDPEALRSAVSGATSFLQFRIDRVLDGYRMDTHENRGRAAAAAAEVVGEHPDGMVRDNYLMSIADRCRVEIQIIAESGGSRP